MCNVAGIFSGAYANNVRSMYTTVSGHIVDCNEFIWGIYIYTDTVAMYLPNELISICGTYIAFEGNTVVGTYMEITW